MLVRFGGFEVDLASGEVRRGGAVRSRLPDQPRKLLEALLERPGELVSHDSLRERLWPDGAYLDHAQGLAKAIQKLRIALGDSADAPRFIETIPRRGYRFLAPVEATEARPAVWRRPLLFTAMGVLATVAVMGIRGFELSHSRDAAPTSSTASLAVLPFRQLEPRQDPALFGLGMADTLITKLSTVPELAVRPTSAILHYDDRSVSALEAGRELAVDYVLEGSLQRESNRVRVSVRLVRVIDAQPLWADVFEQEMSDLFALQDRISERVAARLPLELSRTDGLGIGKRYTTSLDAYEQYLRGRYFFEKRDVDSLRAAIAAFESAIELDPDFALAYAGLAHAYIPLVTLGDIDAAMGNEKVKAAALRAVELDDTLAEAQTARAVAYSVEWDWVNEERSYRKAIALNPNYGLAYHWYAFLLRALGRYEESLVLSREAWRFDPTGLVANVMLATALFHAGHKEEALARIEKTLELDSGFDHALRAAGDMHAALGRLDRARLYFEWAGDRVSLACVAARAGASAEARAVLEEVEASAYQRALVHAGLGEVDKSFERLGDAYREQSSELMHLGFDWRLDPIRSDPRFGELMRRVGLGQGEDYPKVTSIAKK